MDEVTAKNIKTAVAIDHEHDSEATRSELLAKNVNDWAGSVSFLIIHIILFSLWIGFNIFFKVDPYPFIFLTMIVSLESILLAGLLLISQNRSAILQDRRHQLDLQINLLAEQENTMMLRVIDKIAKKLGVDSSELEPFLDETKPGEVMRALEIEQEVKNK